MKPTKMRNKMIYRADANTKSKQLSGMLSKDLRAKYGRRSARIIPGDAVRVVRGEFNNVDGRIKKVSVEQGRVSIEGVKREKSKGEKIDVMIHASNIVVTALHDEKWRMARIGGKSDGTAEAPSAAADQDDRQEPAAETANAPKEHGVADAPDSTKEYDSGRAEDALDRDIQKGAPDAREGEPRTGEGFANSEQAAAKDGQSDPDPEPARNADPGKDSKDDKLEAER